MARNKKRSVQNQREFSGAQLRVNFAFQIIKLDQKLSLLWFNDSKARSQNEKNDEQEHFKLKEDSTKTHNRKKVEFWNYDVVYCFDFVFKNKHW